MSSFLNSRTSVAADTLRGPRIYSTDLFPSLFDPEHADESVILTARALKVKILTKGVVTLNAAYLLSPLAFRLIDSHPDLLSGPSILPAFREDKDTLADLLSSNEDLVAHGIDQVRLDDHLARLDGMIRQVMPWSLGEVGERFRMLLLEGIANPSSLIARELNAAGLGEGNRERIATDLSALDLANSITLREYINSLAEPARKPFHRFAASCYHMVGTGVVRCEAGTDLNPLSAFRAADVVLACRDSRPEMLSEEAIFTEAFMGFALDTIQAAALPTQILDQMEFTTAHKLSETLRLQGFQEKYDGVVRQYLHAAALPDGREALDQLDAEQIAHVAAALAKEFQKSILGEIPNYQTSIQQAAADGLVQARADIAKDFANATPGLGNIISLADGLQHTAKGISAWKESRSVRDFSSALIRADAERVEKIHEAINRLRIDAKKRAVLLDAVAVMSDVHGITLGRA